MTDQTAFDLDEFLPAWEATYEPGNVSDYLIGYANSEAAAKGAAIAWVTSQTDKDPASLEWVQMPVGDQHDHWYDLIQNHDDGIPTDTGVNVRHRIAATVRDAARQATGQPTGGMCELPHATIEEEDACDAARPATGQPDTATPAAESSDVPTPEEGIEDARKVVQHVLQLFLDRVPRAELDAETMADSIADALSDGLTELYRDLARAQAATPAVGQPAAPADHDTETEARDTDVTWSVVFITDSGDAWQEWSKGWHRIEDALVSGENVAGIATVAEVRFVRTTTVRERFNLHQLAAGTES